MGAEPQRHSLLWAPIPLLSWVLPFLGHLGVTDSKGNTFDFTAVGVNVNAFAFGAPTRFLALHPDRAAGLREQVNSSIRQSHGGGGAKTLAGTWDEWLQFSRGIFSQRAYGLMTENCHSFVAHFLNSVRYEQPKQWGPVALAALVFVRGRHGGAADVAKTWLPFAAFMLAGVYCGGRSFLLAWAAICCATVGWFVAYSAFSNRGNARILSI